MKLEQQVCSLELAKKLKELGVKQESYFYWNVDRAFFGQDDMYNIQRAGCPSVEAGYSVDEYAAFTVAELGEMIKRANGQGANVNVPLLTLDGQFTSYVHIPVAGFESKDTSEADARAKMLIYLLENNLIGKE